MAVGLPLSLSGADAIIILLHYIQPWDLSIYWRTAADRILTYPVCHETLCINNVRGGTRCLQKGGTCRNIYWFIYVP